MSEYDPTNTGALFKNDKAGNDKRPDRRGKINIEGVEYKLSGWLKTPKSGGDQFLSLKAERADAQPEQGRERTPQDAYRKPSGQRPATPTQPDDDCSDIPW
jgi:hypothetical protein